MGDINARLGKSTDEVERSYFGEHGESTRNDAGEKALQFLIDTDLVCLNNRERFNTPQYRVCRKFQFFLILQQNRIIL